VFEQEGALDRLEAFASEFGPRFYGLPLNTDTIALVRQPQIVPHQLSLPQGGLVDLDVGEVPFFFHGGETLSWSLESIGQD
jgi:dihydroorotase